MPEFNLPDPKAADFNEKVVQLLQQLFDSAESSTKNYSPIDTPEDGLQVGTTWVDASDGKMRVNTSAGIKIVQFEP